ncbi:hypothetical protein PHMEG_0008681 [Phytophthora megakarya]|uniref:Uncharacterized protein n=1 Tax=Phytophthora megakarya TaxID=4795 RepID=A0A225WI36_9STRA|nr:hypothetical protein PHMEG_0008681 [Phytophthora megakarya]
MANTTRACRTGPITLVVTLITLGGWVFAVDAMTSDSATQIIAAPDKGDELEERAYFEEQKELEVEIDTRDPNATIDTNIYSFAEPTDYVIGLLLDPCRNRAVDCCVDRFGEPAYVDFSAIIAEKISLVDESSAPLDASVSRIGDRPSSFDQNCYLDDNLVPYRLQKRLTVSGLTVTRNYTKSGCIGRLRALIPMDEVVRPACWDYNDSINALASCYSVDGRERETCVAVGFMQSSYIVQCGGDFELSNHCGVFLELHEPDNGVILSQTRLLKQYTSGFRTTTLPLFFQGDHTRTICMGDYEIWWVQRTRYNFIVQKKKKFRITSPQCDFDFATNTYKNYHRIT